jgi:20S proteasome alpha/beta subunit
MSRLEESYKEGMGLEELLALAVKCCSAFKGDSSGLDVAIVRGGGVALHEGISASDALKLGEAG